MPIVGALFEDSFGIPVIDPGRIIFSTNIPPAPPVPLIPTGLPWPPEELIFLSVGQVYTNLLTYSSGISIACTYNFLGYTMSATFAFTCPSGGTVVTVPSLFDTELISWYDKDKSVKFTPKDPTLSNPADAGGTPLVMGNHVENPYVDGDDIIVKVDGGDTYVIRGPVCATQDEVDAAEESMVEMLENGAQCYYLRNDPEGFNNG